MQKISLPPIPHMKHKEWSCIPVDSILLYYKVLRDLPDKDLKVCIIPVEDGVTCGAVYETSLSNLMDKFDVTYDSIREVKNQLIISQLEFIYTATYDFLDGNVYCKENYLH